MGKGGHRILITTGMEREKRDRQKPGAARSSQGGFGVLLTTNSFTDASIVRQGRSGTVLGPDRN